jgi:hypothetical protein
MNKNLESNTKNEAKQYLLDPLSVIIKLAIISQKETGVKLSVSNNILYIQEVGMFQSIVRYYFNYTKSDINFLYNPIELACKFFLNHDKEISVPVKNLFLCALRGLDKLKDTYCCCSVIIICLNYYCNLITNYLGDNINENLFKKNEMSCYYTDELIEKLNNYWTPDKIKLVLEMSEYLYKDDISVDCIKCLEVFMKGVDLNTQLLIG